MANTIFSCKTTDDVLMAVKENNISYVEFWFVDILGTLKSFQLTAKELPNAFNEGMGFDGSSILGFARIEESDMIASPDPTTLQILPWVNKDRPVARMFCDILTPERKPYEGDSRYVLKRALQKAADKGYKFFVGPELEFFIFSSHLKPDLMDSGGYFDAAPLDLGDEIRRKIIDAMQEMGITVEYSHHEVAPSQHEIDLRYDEALGMADTAMTYRVVAKEIARKHGCFISFMPKPIYGINGSGMHVHQSLFKNGRNAFFDAADPFQLSGEAKSYISALLRHAKEYCCVTNQWINSYKRLVPGYEAPLYISWARRNRSTLVRVPMYKPGKESATRIELRSPDPACNPYLAFAAMLSCGLHGIEQGYELPPPVEKNIYDMVDTDLMDHGIHSLPGSLIEAAEAMYQSKLMRETLGDHIHSKLYENKVTEWNRYRSQVTEYEIKTYLPLL